LKFDEQYEEPTEEPDTHEDEDPHQPQPYAATHVEHAYVYELQSQLVYWKLLYEQEADPELEPDTQVPEDLHQPQPM